MFKLPFFRGRGFDAVVDVQLVRVSPEAVC